MTAIAIANQGKGKMQCNGTCNAKICELACTKAGDNFQSPRVRDDVRESRRLFSESRLCWCIELFEFFCGSFRDLAHESCIKGANHVRGGVLKSTLVVDNDSVHTQHAFSP